MSVRRKLLLAAAGLGTLGLAWLYLRRRSAEQEATQQPARTEAAVEAWPLRPDAFSAAPVSVAREHPRRLPAGESYGWNSYRIDPLELRARRTRPAPPPRQVAPTRPRRGVVHKVARTLVVVGVVGAFGGLGTYSAFTATTTNSGNSYAAGTVIIGDNDSGSALMTLSNSKPTDTTTGCIKVTYTGSLSANVHVYGTVSGSLNQYLTLTVTRGTDSSPSFPSCTNFTADATNYIGSGAGVIYSGNLSAFPTDWASGIVDVPTGASTWTNGTAHSYKFVVTVQDNNSAQGLSGTASFTWEARNT